MSVAPSSFARETAMHSPRALNDAVGFCPSSLTRQRSMPMRAASRGVSISGVHPSPMRTALAGSRMGSTSA
jgi:hypothetical protein